MIETIEIPTYVVWGLVFFSIAGTYWSYRRGIKHGYVDGVAAAMLFGTAAQQEAASDVYDWEAEGDFDPRDPDPGDTDPQEEEDSYW